MKDIFNKELPDHIIVPGTLGVLGVGHPMNNRLTIEPRSGSSEFYKLLEECAAIHERKSHDYANNDNPFGNYHFAGMLALMFKHSAEDAGFVGRIGEKIYRLANLESNGKVPKNESIEDTERDIVTITALWMASRRERRELSKGVSSEQGNQDLPGETNRSTSEETSGGGTEVSNFRSSYICPKCKRPLVVMNQMSQLCRCAYCGHAWKAY